MGTAPVAPTRREPAKALAPFVTFSRLSASRRLRAPRICAKRLDFRLERVRDHLNSQARCVDDRQLQRVRLPAEIAGPDVHSARGQLRLATHGEPSISNRLGALDQNDPHRYPLRLRKRCSHE